MFIEYLFTNFRYFIYWIVIMIFSVCFHELFHALAAYQQGDSTAKDQGYFTMNPIKHMGVSSLIMLILVGLCWGACPVNPRNFKGKHSDAIISFAGPFANLLLVFIFAFLCVIFRKYTFFTIPLHIKINLIYLFSLACIANAALAILNMIPLPPLDGSKVAENVFPALGNFYSQIGNAGYGILFALFWIAPEFSHLFWQISGSMALRSHLVKNETKIIKI